MSIGEFARATGLAVSTLRFYDSVGVLVPEHVDPATSHRRYGRTQVATGRLVARLRRVGLPVASIRTIVCDIDDRVLIQAVLDEHLQRLEEGFEAARTELALLTNDLTDPEGFSAARFMTDARRLARALRSVMFALPAAPESGLSAVLIDVSGDEARLVATDRYRLATSVVPLARGTNAQARCAVAQSDLAGVLAFLGNVTDLDVTIGDHQLRLEDGEESLAVLLADAEFPNYHVVLNSLDSPAHSATMDRDSLRDLLESASYLRGVGPENTEARVVTLYSSPEGFVSTEPATPDQAPIVVNYEFLLQAVEAGPGEQLQLDFSTPIAPLAIRFSDEPRTFSMLMPTRIA